MRSVRDGLFPSRTHREPFQSDALGDWKLEDSSQDIRGRPLVSPEGERFGVIDDLLVDRDNERVTAVRLEDGRVTPIEPLQIHDNCVVYGEEATRYADQGAAEGHVVDEEVVPIVEERVAIGKRVSDHGRVINVRTDIVTYTVPSRTSRLYRLRRPRSLRPGFPACFCSSRSRCTWSEPTMREHALTCFGWSLPAWVVPPCSPICDP